MTVKEKAYHVNRGLWGNRVIAKDGDCLYPLEGGESKDIARSILTDYMGEEPSKTYHQGFVEDFIDPLNRQLMRYVIPLEAIKEWLEYR